MLVAEPSEWSIAIPIMVLNVGIILQLCHHVLLLITKSESDIEIMGSEILPYVRESSTLQRKSLAYRKITKLCTFPLLALS